MYKRLISIWSYYGFELAVIASLIFIGACALYYYFNRDKGTWNTHADMSILNHTKSRRGPTKESKGEIECKRVLEKLFKRPFNKERPSFLSNPVTGGGNNLELDCFNSQIGLAVEYQGCQHYKYVPFFHKNKEAFQNQKYRDEMKRVKCKQNGITLIEVPYTIDIHKIEDYLVKMIRKHGFNV